VRLLIGTAGIGRAHGMELMMEEDDDVRSANLFPRGDGVGDGDGDGGRSGVDITIIRHVTDE